jgi:hypothetical protein
MIGVEKFFNDREDIFGIDRYGSFFLHHGCFSYGYKLIVKHSVLSLDSCALHLLLWAAILQPLFQ